VDDELQGSVPVRSPKTLANNFYTTLIQHLTQTWRSVLVMQETLWKNDLNFVKEVPTIYVNFIVVVIIVVRKNRKCYF